MSYQVIARKWRPQSFDEVTGQEPITRTLRNAIEHERLHHAYLFSGARGVGKTTTARLLAKALNCHKSDGPMPTPCAATDPDACPSCREIAEGRSIDVLEIDAASNTGVDNVRDAIIGSVAISPARDRYKVFIIDEVHMLSGAAFNALLKTLEEPPPRVVFIMATTEKHKLPDTILSRCQQFEFRTIATPKIVERLRLIAGAEKISISDNALREIARAGEGSMRDAQSAFDQVISFSGTEIKAEDVEMALGLASTEMLARVVRGIAEQKPQEALAVVDDLVMRGHDLRNFCRDLLAHLRNLLVAKVAGESAELLDASATGAGELMSQAEAFSESDLVRFFHSLTETETNLRAAAHPRYQLEVGLVKLMEMRRLAPLGQVIERLAALEDSLRTGKAPAINSTPPAASGGSTPGGPAGGRRETTSKASTPRASGSGSSVAAPEPVAAEEQAHSALPVEEPFSLVENAPPPALKLVPPPDKEAGNVTARSSLPAQGLTAEAGQKMSAPGSIIEDIKVELEKRRRMFIVGALEGARKAKVAGEELYVEFAPEARKLRDDLAKPENIKLLREVCGEVMGRDMGVRIVVKELGANDEDEPLSKQDEARLEKQQLREIAEQDSTMQYFLQKYRGEILDVRRADGERSKPQ
ncbi:MAG: DNA polymerase III subunit gamma/tau [Pyrinomonadaceae bacterium]